MLKIIGKATSINVRKVLWTCVELGLPFTREGMDWQATELNNAWRYAFMALVRGSAAHADPAQIAASVGNWNRHVGILDEGLAAAGAFVAGEAFTLADIVIGLSLNRWSMTPMARPDYPHISSYLARLADRPGYRDWCANGVP